MQFQTNQSNKGMFNFIYKTICKLKNSITLLIYNPDCKIHLKAGCSAFQYRLL